MIESGQEYYFPTPIWKYDTNRDNSKLLEIIYDERNKSDGVINSNAGGWQSQQKLLERDKETSKFILEHAKICLKDMNIKPSFKPYIKNSWANINYKGNYNRSHAHPNSFISGAFYLKTPENCGNIKFFEPRSLRYWNELEGYFNDSNHPYSYHTWFFPPHEGFLLLFPSWLEHEVEPNNSNEERISISFNIGLE